MKYLAALLIVFTFLANARFCCAQEPLRAPAVPLVVCDPYFSIWSAGDQLNRTATTHWTGRPHRLLSSIAIDGNSLRLIGDTPTDYPPMNQTSVSILPTRTIYKFKDGGVELTLTFLTPALPSDLDLLSWPLTYICFDVTSTDGRAHAVSISFQASAEITVNDAAQPTTWSTPSIAGLSTMAVGSQTQDVLGRTGDDLRIDWGHLYISAPSSQKPMWNNQQLQFDLGSVTDKLSSRWLMLAYDDLYSIQYMKQNLRPFWRRHGWEAADLLKAGADRYESIAAQCQAFDDELMRDLRKAGGDNYAALGALCFRQCFAAGKFVADANGQPLQFSKENHSNGCIATADVFYPMSPQFLLFGPTLAKSFLVPYLNYAASERWKFDFAPHDLGQYPWANGQVYGGGERSADNQMPVEECGNILLLIGAIAELEGNASFASQYWPQVERWAEYLINKGFDPDNQLCTDDFAGHLAHNVNLSAKAICAIGAYAKLCDMRGDSAKSQKAYELARAYAERWSAEAGQGDHTRLTFDAAGSWSQKYNLVWDRILNLNLFTEEVKRQEVAFYRRNQQRYGLPLDNRAAYTKLDWITWTATLTQDRADFDALIDPLIRFVNETPDRSPLTDWYDTHNGKKVGFTARPVVGGVFLQMLYDKVIWSKWAARERFKASNWAAIPKAPLVSELIKTANTEPASWRYTTTKPDHAWTAANFDASSWSQGLAGFGTRGTPNTSVHTEWTTSDIWLVRDIELDEVNHENLNWLVHHDEDTEIFINGQLAARFTGYTVQYALRPVSDDAQSLLRKGTNRIAVHCHQTGGGQYIDVGLATVTQQN